MFAQEPKTLTIATRESPLALWQANHVRARLQALYPACSIELLGLTTEGDRVLDRPLQQVGGKGLFIKELEVALLEGRADLAVHSLKDVPMELPHEFGIAAFLPREDPRDAVVLSERLLARLADGSSLPSVVLGTSSLRRLVQVRDWVQAKWQLPTGAVTIKPVRGNVGTRLRKLAAGEFDALVLAAAGLIRLGWQEQIHVYLTPEESLPAPGQGVLAIEILAGRNEVQTWLNPLHDPTTAALVTAERAFARELQGNCQTPLAAHAVSEEAGTGSNLWLRGLVATMPFSEKSNRVFRGELRGPLTTANQLGKDLAAQFRVAGYTPGDIP